MKRVLGYLLIVAAVICLPAKTATAQNRMGGEFQTLGPSRSNTLSADSASSSREAANAYLAQELAKLQRDVIIAQAPMGNTSVSEGLIKQWIDRMAALRDAFKDNPYIRVTGFAVSVPPSVSVNVDFK